MVIGDLHVLSSAHELVKSIQVLLCLTFNSYALCHKKVQFTLLYLYCNCVNESEGEAGGRLHNKILPAQRRLHPGCNTISQCSPHRIKSGLIDRVLCPELNNLTTYCSIFFFILTFNYYLFIFLHT